jgi:hypothetical protein
MIGGEMTVTLIGSNFGVAQIGIKSIFLRFGTANDIVRSSVSVYVHSNLIIVLNMQFHATKNYLLTKNVANVEISMLQSNFAPILVPQLDFSCQSSALKTDCMDCCLRKCLHGPSASFSIQVCENVCYDDCEVFQTECTSPVNVVVLQSKYGDCVNISWNVQQVGSKCSFVVHFTSSFKVYQTSTTQYFSTFCGFFQGDLLQDIKVAALNSVTQLKAWSEYHQSFRVLNASTPSRPLEIVMEEANNMLNVSWQPPIHNGALSILNYKVIFNNISILADCCSSAFQKPHDSCVQVVALNSEGEGEIEESCISTSQKSTNHLEILHLENVLIFPGQSKVQTITIHDNLINDVTIRVTQNEKDVSFASLVFLSNTNLIASLSEKACGSYLAMMIMRSSDYGTINGSFSIVARNSWTTLAPQNFPAHSKTTITVFGCFYEISQSVLNIECAEWNLFLQSSRTSQEYHEFEFISWEHASCKSTVRILHQRGPDLVSIPFNSVMRGLQAEPTLEIVAGITQILPQYLSSESVESIIVTGAGFSNFKVDWGVYDDNDISSALDRSGTLTVGMNSVLFRTSCQTITTRQLICKVPPWTLYHPAGPVSLIFYDSDTGLKASSEILTRVVFLPLMTAFFPSLAYAIGGSIVTLQGSGFNSSKFHTLRQAGTPKNNLAFTQVSASLNELTFLVPAWHAGPVERIQIELKDDDENNILNEKISFEFKSVILKVYPPKVPCITSTAGVFTLTGVGFSPDSIYNAFFFAINELTTTSYEMNSTCVYKSPTRILCRQVDWCLVNIAAQLSVQLVAKTGPVVSAVESIHVLEVQYFPQIQEIRPRVSTLSGSGFLFMSGKGFPSSASGLLCIFLFKETDLNSSVTFCNATTIVCSIPNWGRTLAAQTVQVYFKSTHFQVPPSNSIAIDLLPSAWSVYPTIQSITGGTLVHIEGSGFDKFAFEFKCVFLQGTYNLMTPFSVQNPSSGTCATPYWTPENLINRTYEVMLIYDNDAKKIDAGVIQIG